MLTTKDLADKVRELAAEYPDALYIKPNKARRLEANLTQMVSCFYTIGKVENGPQEEGCIVGQAARKLKPDIDLRSCENRGVGSICKALGISEIKLSDKYFYWTSVVQEVQDLGDSWSDAVKKADESVRLEEHESNHAATT